MTYYPVDESNVILCLYFLHQFTEEQADPCSNVTCSHPLQECRVKSESKPVCDCEHIVCTREYHPVCGADGQTYPTKCMMDLLTCEANKLVSVDYEGECRQGDGNCK